MKKLKYLGGRILGDAMLEVGKVYDVIKGPMVGEAYLKISANSKLLIYKEELKRFEVVE